MLMYWLALWKLDGTGIRVVEIQTLFWFVATIVGSVEPEKKPTTARARRRASV